MKKSTQLWREIYFEIKMYIIRYPWSTCESLDVEKVESLSRRQNTKNPHNRAIFNAEKVYVVEV